MKKIIFLLSLISTTLLADAQMGLHIGAQINGGSAGILNQNVYGGYDGYTGSTELEYHFTPSFGGGLVGGYNFTDNIGAQIEFNYTSMGEFYEDKYQTMTRDVALKYLQIPVMAKFILGDGSAKFYTMTGPQFGLLSSANIIFNYADGTIDTTIDAKARFSKNDLQWVLKLGTDVNFTDAIYLNAGMGLGISLSDINDATDPNGPMNPGWHVPNSAGIYDPSRNAQLYFTVGLHYLLGQ